MYKGKSQSTKVEVKRWKWIGMWKAKRGKEQAESKNEKLYFKNWFFAKIVKFHILRLSASGNLTPRNGRWLGGGVSGGLCNPPPPSSCRLWTPPDYYANAPGRENSWSGRGNSRSGRGNSGPGRGNSRPGRENSRSGRENSRSGDRDNF